MKLNLGSSGVFYEGYTAVDMDERIKRVYPDTEVVIADVRYLPFENDSIEEIFASHLLEHFDFREPVLEEWKRVLQPGGLITVVVPDIEKTYAMWKSGVAAYWGTPSHPRVVDRGYINAVAFGAWILDSVWDGPGQVHRQIFVGSMLLDAMRIYFPDAQEVTSCPVRECTGSETMVSAHK